MPELERVETNRLPISGVGNMNAWELVQRGWSQLYDSPTEGCAEVRTLFTQAIELDPSNSRAYSGIGYSHFMDALMGAVDQRDLKLEEIIAAGRRAVELDPTDYRAYTILGLGYLRSGQLDLAISVAHPVPWTQVCLTRRA